MSDRPLFQDMDEQEAVYAPQQLPDGSAPKSAADTETRAGGEGVDRGAVAVPVAGILGAGAGAGGMSGTSGAPGGIGPALGAAALADETRDTDADERR